MIELINARVVRCRECEFFLMYAGRMCCSARFFATLRRARRMAKKRRAGKAERLISSALENHFTVMSREHLSGPTTNCSKQYWDGLDIVEIPSASPDEDPKLARKAPPPAGDRRPQPCRYAEHVEGSGCCKAAKNRCSHPSHDEEQVVPAHRCRPNRCELFEPAVEDDDRPGV